MGSRVSPDPYAAGATYVMQTASHFIHRFSQLTVIDATLFAVQIQATQVRLRRTDKHPEHELHVVAQR